MMVEDIVREQERPDVGPSPLDDQTTESTENDVQLRVRASA